MHMAREPDGLYFSPSDPTNLEDHPIYDYLLRMSQLSIAGESATRASNWRGT